MQVLDSFIEAALSLSNVRAGDELIGMIVRYLRTGAEPRPRTEAQRAVLLAIRPAMDNSKTRITNGQYGALCRWGCADGEANDEADSKRGSKRGSKTDSKPDSKADSKPHGQADSKRGSKPDSKSQKNAIAKRKREEEEEKEKTPPKGGVEKKDERRFSPPSVSEVAEYVSEQGFSFDPEAFCAFYESKGWKVGTAPMRSWKAACMTWEKRERRSPKAMGEGGVSCLAGYPDD